MTDTKNSSASASDPERVETENQPKTESGPAPASQAASEAAETAEPDALAAMTAERDKLREQLLRTAADFDNFRKRSKRDMDDARQRGKDDVVRELLPVFDNLERAVQSADTATDVKSVVEGVRMVLKLFEDTSERMGLARVPSLGERFDPAVHEAIQQQETDAQPPGTIIAEVVPGYRFGQRLVRPAMVVVARKPSEPKPEAAAGDGASAPSGGASGASARPAGESKRPDAAPSSDGNSPKAERDTDKSE